MTAGKRLHHGLPRPAADFAGRLIAWQRSHGRHDLPWQGTSDPYRVWLSEIMLQQTQVATVIPYYERFLRSFPTLAELAAAPADAVMAAWSGLGYYARARNLHACAKTVMAQHGGRFPHEAEAIAGLPGIGRSTANAIAVFCFGARLPILDGNVKRVLCRAFGIDGYPGAAETEKRLWALADSLRPAGDCGAYIQAQMDLGAGVCTRGRPRCEACPLAADCVARRDGRIDELPAPKPRRELPQREAILLILIADGRVLLERRPPAGIWGGLWSLPELPSGADVRHHAERLGCVCAGAATALPPLDHTFTHFRLRLRPLRLAATPLPGVAEDGRHWWQIEELAAAALPAPVRRLLAGPSGFP